MMLNLRHPHGVFWRAGHQHSAESWGTGRAVSRVPRVSGGGTHRSGQGAFGNMCRGGRMFSPIRTWRRWHRMINVNQRRYALVSALAASAVPGLVMARGHKIEQVAEIPLVVKDEDILKVQKTEQAVELLKKLRAYPDISRVKASIHIHPGRAKSRNRRYKGRVGPLIVYHENQGITKSFRNIPGVDVINVNCLNLLKVAPGGHPGRFIIWTEGAFKRLDQLYGTYSEPSKLKKGYTLPRPLITNPDITRIMRSEEIQPSLRPIRPRNKYPGHKKNPLKNLYVMVKLNPYALTQRRAMLKKQMKLAKRNAVLKSKEKPLKEKLKKTIKGIQKEKKVQQKLRKKYLKKLLA